jgi:ADP-ribose pyrophosphatase YjhB (NUDIX family)
MKISKYKSHQRILVAVDCIIFGFDGSQLKALLIKRGFEPEKGKWSLMGGFVGKDEDADEAAARVLYELTGLRNIYMEQLYTFSDVQRDSAGRVISIAYFALINIADYSEQMQLEHEARWFLIHKIPRLIFDQLQSLYEAIYDTPLDKRNFTKKILSLGVLNKLNEKEKQSSRKGAYYYVFDSLKYKKLQSNGVKFI